MVIVAFELLRKFIQKMESSSGTKELLDFIFKEWKLMIILTLVFFIYFYYTSTFDHFSNKGIKFMKPIIFFGNLLPRLIARKSFHESQLQIYSYFKGNRYGGFFDGRRPVLYILDPDLIKAVTIKDFDHFVNRVSVSTNEPRYIKRFLLNLKDTEWKTVRSIITPTFSSLRLKNMFPLMKESSQKLVTYLTNMDCSSVEIKKVMGYYTLDVIGACAFGIDTQVLSDENAPFVKAAENFNYMPIPKRVLLLLLLIVAPNLLKYLNVSFLNQKYVRILIDILQKAKAERRLSKNKRNDFLQQLIDAAASEQTELRGSYMELDDDTIDAQSLLFLIAGYETSSALLSFAIYSLATHPDIQKTLRSHIQNVTKGEELSYESLSELEYLDGFLLETLRVYPPLAKVDRVCVKPYTLPGTSITLDVDERISIPIYGIHMDADIYPEPEKFRPERFMKEEKKARPGHLFLAFGSGPRNCIGLRFAMVSVKLAMVTLLTNYKFLTCSKTETPLKYNKNAFMLKSQNGIWVKLEKI